MVNGDLCHELLLKKITPSLGYDKARDFGEWKTELKDKFVALTGIDTIAANACAPELRIVSKEDKGTYTLIRYEFFSEIGETVPCYLLIPKSGKKKYPVAITLQGHVTGFHNSIGVAKYAGDEDGLDRKSVALQAVENGFIALAIEQRGMGERRPTTPLRGRQINCRFASFVAISMGRTLIGERVWDVSRAIDTLSNFPECDTDKILITGNSGGGTASYYSACYDERIKLSVPSCAFCPYKDSVLTILHCECNQIPRGIEYFEMQDLSALIFPRRLIVVSGGKDDIFPIDGARRGFETVKAIYADNGKADNCRMIETPEPHWWCKDIVWNAIKKEAESLGWF